MFQKTITLLVVSSLFRSVLGGPPPKQYNFQFLRGGFETIVDCESPASISCVEGIMSGDKNFNGIATVVFDEIVPIDLLGSFNYAGTYEFDINGGHTVAELSAGTATCTSTFLSTCVAYDVQSKISVSGGTGFFNNRECEFTTSGTLDFSRFPFNEILDVTGTCTVVPGN